MTTPETNQSLDKSVLKTLAYADIFNYPLTRSEIHRFLISSVAKDNQSVSHALTFLFINNKISKRQKWYFLPGREKIVSYRKKREAASKKKLAMLKRFTHHFLKIPTIRLIAVSGGLAMENADEDDDIDLFIISEKNKMWLTRLAILLVLQSLGKRRKREEKKAPNKICVNMFMEEPLTLTRDQQDLYGAHEIVQMVPVLNRNNTHQRFLQANEWVGGFLPNSLDTRLLRYKDTKKTNPPNILISQSLNILNYIAKKVQLWYMRGYRTREIISDTLLAFHPKDYRKEILRSFDERLKKYL